MLADLRTQGPGTFAAIGAVVAVATLALAAPGRAQVPAPAPAPPPAANAVPGAAAPPSDGIDVTGKSPEQVMKELEQRADRSQAEHPASVRSEALKQEAVKAASSTLGNLKGDDRTAFAASVYFGFWSVNTRTRPDMCAEQGVGISPLTAQIVRQHEPETARARTLWRQQGVDEDATYRSMEPQLRRITEIDLQGIVAARKLDGLRQACEFLRDNAAQLAPHLTFARVQPDAQKVLMGAP